jgi:predicted GNAT superfamily acetyltransferase
VTCHPDHHRGLILTKPGTTGSAITISDIEQISQLREVEALQKEAWGFEDRDIVPLTQLIAAKETGGILLGAFDGGKLVGFVYGFIGFERGHVTIHSHMLAVKPAYRNLHLGYRLKLVQRERALARGIIRMTWTFDPLQSLNAYLNFTKLGVVSEQYKVNFYGEETSSFLHSFGTDRLWATWLLDSQRVIQRVEGPPFVADLAVELDGAMPLVILREDGGPHRCEPAEHVSCEHLLIEIPSDIDSLRRERPELARAWQEVTRGAFTQALASGYVVRDFIRRGVNGKQTGAYLLNLGGIT